MAIFLSLNVIAVKHNFSEIPTKKGFFKLFFLTNILKIKDVGENEASCGGTGPKGSGRPVYHFRFLC